MVQNLGKATKVVVEFLNEHQEDIKKFYETVKSVFQLLFQSKSENLIIIDKEFIKWKDIVQIASENKVSGANEVCAILEKDEKYYYIYLAYSKDRELLSQESNKYINIRTEGIARDVENTFGNNKMIILK